MSKPRVLDLALVSATLVGIDSGAPWRRAVRPGLLRAMPLQDLSGGNNRPAPTQAPLATKPAVDLNMTTASWDAPLPFARAGKRLTRTGCSTPACRLLDQYMAGATDQPVITPDLECD